MLAHTTFLCNMILYGRGSEDDQEAKEAEDTVWCSLEFKEALKMYAESLEADIKEGL